jgi:hypothetical protein
MRQFTNIISVISVKTLAPLHPTFPHKGVSPRIEKKLNLTARYTG